MSSLAHWLLCWVHEEDLDHHLKLPPASLADLIGRLADHWRRGLVWNKDEEEGEEGETEGGLPLTGLG